MIGTFRMIKAEQKFGRPNPSSKKHRKEDG